MLVKIDNLNSRPQNIHISNKLIFSKTSFGIAKICSVMACPQLSKIDFDQIKPLIDAIEEYQKTNPEFNAVEIYKKDGGTISISF